MTTATILYPRSWKITCDFTQIACSGKPDPVSKRATVFLSDAFPQRISPLAATCRDECIIFSWQVLAG
jgi:hypothetical protein